MGSRFRLWGGVGIGAAAGNDVGVNVEPTPVGVQQGLLALDQAVSGVDVPLGGALWRGAGRHGIGIAAAAGNKVSVGTEPASVSVQQVLLVGYQLIANCDLLRGHRLLSRRCAPHPGQPSKQ